MRKLGIGGWLTKRKNKIPKVKAFLDEKVETLQEFKLIKIEWAIEELIAEKRSITKWRLLEKAGIKERYIQSIQDNIFQNLTRDKGNGDIVL